MEVQTGSEGVKSAAGIVSALISYASFSSAFDQSDTEVSGRSYRLSQTWNEHRRH